MNIVRPLIIVATLSIAFLLSSCLKDDDQYTYKVADWEPCCGPARFGLTGDG
jgi:hypothetical protein